MTTSKLIIDVARMKNLRQEEFASLTTSAFVEIHLLAASQNESMNVRTTPVKNETAAPFFNETFEYDVSEFAFPGGDPKSKVQLGFEFRAMDHNFDPPHAIGIAQIAFEITESKKGEHTVTLQPPADEEGVDPDRGTLVVRWVCKVHKPHAAPEDPHADITLGTQPVFSGDYHLIPGEQRLFLWFHMIHDSDFATKLESALVRAFATSTTAASSQRSRGSSPQRGSQAAAAEAAAFPASSFSGVVHYKWKCKRVHQVFTKLRIACERFVREGPQSVSFTHEEEMVAKKGFKELSVIRNLSVANVPAPQPAAAAAQPSSPSAHAAPQPPSVAAPTASNEGEAVEIIAVDDPASIVNSGVVKAELTKLYLLFATEEDVDDLLGVGNMGPGIANWKPSFEQQSKMKVFLFGRVQCECLLACLLERVCLGIHESVSQAIAKEEFERDTVALSVLATPGQAADVPVAKLRLNAVKGENAMFLFFRILQGVASFWAETITETEYLLMLRSFGPAVKSAKLRAEAQMNVVLPSFGSTEKKKKKPSKKKSKK